MKNRSEHHSWIKKVSPQITPPSLADNTADVDRLIKGIRKKLEGEEVFLDFSLHTRLPHLLREYGYRVSAVLFKGEGVWHLMDIFPLHEKKGIFGVAVDLGTAMVAVRLLELTSQETIGEISFHNPQLEIGPDILTRIHYAAKNGGLEILQNLLRDRLNHEINQLAKKHGIPARSIVGMSAAGNTTMTHLFLGLDPYWICREPYIPVINRLGLIRSKALRLTIHPEAPVLIFPNVGSYFGGDLIAGILASGMTEKAEPTILVDVGTNAEVVLGNRHWLMACAGAAGPALEGGVARMGMMAGPGVIEKVRIEPSTNRPIVQTIGNQPPVGICGSGLIDLVAELYMNGLVDVRGKYVTKKCGSRLIEMDEIKHFVIVSPEHSGTGQPLTLSQPDIDALMRSKAAMYTILTTLTNTVNIPLNDFHTFYISGTFGAYINPRSAVTIGMIPDLPRETYVSLGNTSLEGASMALLSSQAKERAFRIRDQVTYLELNVNQEFMNLFSAAKFIPHTDRSLFPSVKARIS